MGERLTTSTMTAFTPHRHAFRFPNRFINAVWDGRFPPLLGPRVQMTTRGRCGGMAFASLDLFYAGRPAPTASDFAGSHVPPDGHPLADYIRVRQLHSMLTGWHGARNGLTFLRWSMRSTQTLKTRTQHQMTKILASLDAGEPVVLGLVRATGARLSSLGRNHQAVCYGYRIGTSGHPELLIYDPNHPFPHPSHLSPDDDSGDGVVVLRRSSEAEQSSFPYESTRGTRTDRWRGFFVEHYHPHMPRIEENL